MILNLFRPNPSRVIVDRLYGEIVAAGRRPAFYQPPFAVADSVDGRFEVLTLHACLVLRRLSALPAPAPDLAQDVANRVFSGFDAALREMGVGDLTVPKRIKAMASDFGGRSKAYGAALDGEGDLAGALARNVYGSGDPAVATPLADYVRTAARAIDTMPFSIFEQGPVVFPDPSGSKAKA